LTVSEARANELSNQGILRRIWGGITGKNQKIRSDIDRNVTKVQYASQQMIQKLAEQNLLTFDMVTAVNNKLNTLVLELDKEINQVYQTMLGFFKQTKSDIIQMEERVGKLEKNIELLHWNTTIEYQMYDGVEYTELHDIAKIVCVSNDFFHRTKGVWSTGDLMLLKSTLAELGLVVKSNISFANFYRSLIEKPSLIERLFEGISLEGLDVTETYEAPLVKGIEKLTKINGEEKYVYETIVAQIQSVNVSYDKQNLQLSIVHQYLLHTASMNADVEINLFDFVVGLLVDLHMINNSIIHTQSEEAPILEEQKIINETGDYDVFLVEIEKNRIDVISTISEILSVPLEDAQKLVKQLPLNIVSKTSKERSRNLVDILIKVGAYAIVKTYIEKYHLIRAASAGYLGLKSKSLCTGDNYTALTSIGELVKDDQIIGFISVNISDLKIPSWARIFGNIRAGVNGEVIKIFGEHGDEVKMGDPTFLIKESI
jgi:hypothetical protein